MTIKRTLEFGVLFVVFFISGNVFAQGVAGFGADYGQATGNRRQMNRTIVPEQLGGTLQHVPALGAGISPSGGLVDGFQKPSIAGSYQIHLLGEVGKPGTYRVFPSTRIDEAIGMAGGISGRGSTRMVELRRTGSVSRYDLLMFREFGDLSQNPFLLDNDVVFVPFAERSVMINGPVKKSGLFELAPREKSVWDVIRLAGGYTAGVSLTTPLTIIRYVNEQKQLIEIPNEENVLKETPVQHGDIIIVAHLLTKDRKFDYNVAVLPADNVFYPSFNDNIFVLGAVELPGAYPFNPINSIRDFVSMAGPIRHAKLNGVYILTADGRKVRGRKIGHFKISPGDTIVVPERAWTVDNTLKWYNTFANSIITGFTLRELVRR